MSKLAIVFSGQGAQFAGMGKELYETSSIAQKVFDTCEKIRPGTINQCLTASKEELSFTVNTQPCVFAVSMAAAETLKQKGTEFSFAAGFSVGEIPALTFAGVFSLADGFKAVCKRAEFMHAAAQKNPGAMAVVLKLSAEKTEELCKEAGIYAVNYNCPGQTVAAGRQDGIKKLTELAMKEGGRVLPLAVSGAFHSPYMDVAASEFKKYLQTIPIKAPVLPVYANTTGLPYVSESIKETLSAQINHPVRWQQTIENMLQEGVTDFSETGPGNVLTGLISKTREYKIR